MSLLDLAARAETADGVAPFNEASLLALRDGVAARVLALRTLDDGTLVGAAYASGDAPVEVVVDPDHRRTGIGRGIVDELLADEESQFWAHGDLPGAQALAAAAGLSVGRVLLALRLELHEAPSEIVPDGVTLRTYTDADLDAIVEVNARAFASHPEQGSMDRADFLRRTSSDWFDPEGLFVAEKDRPRRRLPLDQGRARHRRGLRRRHRPGRPGRRARQGAHRARVAPPARVRAADRRPVCRGRQLARPGGLRGSRIQTPHQGRHVRRPCGDGRPLTRVSRPTPTQPAIWRRNSVVE